MMYRQNWNSHLGQLDRVLGKVHWTKRGRNTMRKYS